MADSEELQSSRNSLSSHVEQLVRLLTEEPLPSEYDIAILRSTKEGDPFLKRDGHLGLHAGDLPWLARNFHLEYRNVRSKMLVDERNSHSQQIIMNVTSCLLLVCPDHATAWADRRRALLHNAEENSVNQWKRELKYLDLLMTKHTKAPTSWFHRKYVFQQIANRTSSLEKLIDFARKEIKLCIRVADRYPKNYYAWTHRIYVLRSLQDLCDVVKSDNLRRCVSEAGGNMFRVLLKEELSTTEPWLRTHLSDHSAAHFGGCVLRMLLNMQLMDAKIAGEGISIAVEAIESARRLIRLYPAQEVLWIFRRICSHALLLFLAPYNKQQGGKVTEIATMFWTREIDCMLLDGNNEATIDGGSNSEIHQEKMRSQTNQVSYVAWLLEHIWNGEEEYQLLGLFNVDKADIKGKREKIQAFLKCCHNVPHNVFRKAK